MNGVFTTIREASTPELIAGSVGLYWAVWRGIVVTNVIFKVGDRYAHRVGNDLKRAHDQLTEEPHGQHRKQG